MAAPSAGPAAERRNTGRAALSVPAAVMVAGRRLTYAWLKNISEQGAMLRAPTMIAPGTVVELVLYASAFPTISVTAVVVSAVPHRGPSPLRLGLEFIGVDRSTHDAITKVISATRRRGLDPCDCGVLVLSDPSLTYGHLEDAIAKLGRYPIAVHSRSDVARWLQDSTTRIDTVMISADRPRLEVLELFDFVAAESPQVRRVLFAATPLPPGLWSAFISGRLDAVLHLPANIADLACALGTSPEGIDPYCG
ncbi:MAG: PilZ domain-containing protein [Deltaproteobacteria bacterium]|nr:PilZ domain-containing protein [Deltaproteobacteria bacterium]